MGKNNELKKLKGTEKQVRFATDVRRYVLYQLEHADEQGVDHVYADKMFSVIKRTSNAKFILKTFANSFYNHYVLAHLDRLFDIKKELKDAKTLKQSDVTGFSLCPQYDFYNDYYDYYNHYDEYRDDSAYHKIKDVPFEDKEAQNNEIIGRNTKILNNNLEYLKEDIASGYYSYRCEEKINNAISELKNIDYDVEKYKFELIKLEPKKYIFEINKRLTSMLTDPHTDTKVQSLVDDVNFYIKASKRYNSDIKNLAPEKVKEYEIEKIDIKDFKARLDDAEKHAKKYSDQKPVKNEKFDLWFLSCYPYQVCDKFIYRDSAIEVLQSEKRYLNQNDIVVMQDIGELSISNDYPSGYYYYITYRNIDDTDKGKAMLKQYHEEQKSKKERQQRWQKLYDELDTFVHKYMDCDNLLSISEFEAKYEKKCTEAEQIYERSNFYYEGGKYYINDLVINHDYLAINGNLLFIADYNGSDGDDWGLNNYHGYRVWVVRVSDEQLNRLKRITSELTKLEKELSC